VLWLKVQTVWFDGSIFKFNLSYLLCSYYEFLIIKFLGQKSKFFLKKDLMIMNLCRFIKLIRAYKYNFM